MFNDVDVQSGFLFLFFMNLGRNEAHPTYPYFQVPIGLLWKLYLGLISPLTRSYKVRPKIQSPNDIWVFPPRNYIIFLEMIFGSTTCQMGF